MRQRPKEAPETTWKLGREPPCGALSMSPPCAASLGLCSQSASHPLDTSAEFTSLTRSPFPPQGRSLMGIFEQVLGTQFEAEIRVLHEKGKREKKGAPSCGNPKPCSE